MAEQGTASHNCQAITVDGMAEQGAASQSRHCADGIAMQGSASQCCHCTLTSDVGFSIELLTKLYHFVDLK